MMDRIKNWRSREAEKLRGMTLPQKLDYLFTYYKTWFAGGLVLLLFLGYVGDVIVQGRKETVLLGFFTNDEYNLFPAGKLRDDFAPRLDMDRMENVVFDDDLYIDLEGRATDYTAASNGKIIAYMAVGELDFVVTTEAVYRHFAGQIPMRDLSGLLPEALYAELSPYIDSVTDGEGKNVPSGIELSQSRFVRDEDGDVGSYYLFVPYSAPHDENICTFIQYCFS